MSEITTSLTPTGRPAPSQMLFTVVRNSVHTGRLWIYSAYEDEIQAHEVASKLNEKLTVNKYLVASYVLEDWVEPNDQ